MRGLRRAYSLGLQAGNRGEPTKNNPYARFDHRKCWDDGHKFGTAEREQQAAPKLTAPMRRELEYAARNEFGQNNIYLGAPNGLRMAGWRRVMERLQSLGFVKPYPHGGYEITESGRAAIANT